MAIVRTAHHWPDDDGCTVFEVEIDELSYPDALADARAEVMRMFHEATGETASVDDAIADLEAGE